MTDSSTELRAAASNGTSTAVAERSGPPTLRDLLKKQEAGIARALPTHVPAGSYMRAILTDLSRTPKLLSCTPNSFFGAVMTAAQLGLTPGPALGEAYLVPYGSTVQLIVGYRGYLALARKSGFLLSIAARERCANDLWEFEYGLEEKLRHIPAEGDRGDVLGYYGVAQFKDGGHLIHYMTVADINRRRARSKAKDDGPWKTDYDAMARKTVIRAMAPWLPQSAEMAQAYESDGAVLNMRGDEIIPDFVESDQNISDAEVVEEAPPLEQGRKSSTTDQRNEVLALLEQREVPGPERNALIGRIIGRTVRGVTGLSFAEAEKLKVELAQPAGSEPSDEVAPVDEDGVVIAEIVDEPISAEMTQQLFDALDTAGVPEEETDSFISAAIDKQFDGSRPLLGSEMSLVLDAVSARLSVTD